MVTGTVLVAKSVLVTGTELIEVTVLVEASDKTDKMLGVTCKSGSKIIGLSITIKYKNQNKTGINLRVLLCS